MLHSVRLSTETGQLTHPNWVCWIGTSGWNSRQSVDSALRQGRTVASKEGGLAYFTLIYGSQTREIGGKLTGVPKEAALKHRITIKPVITGTYTIRLYRGTSALDPTAVSVFYRSMSMTAGQTYDLGLLDMELFPGGKHCYYLQVVRGTTEYIYTSPIYVTQ